MAWQKQNIEHASTTRAPWQTTNDEGFMDNCNNGFTGRAVNSTGWSDAVDRIADLQAGQQSVTLAGIVLAKDDVKTFEPRNADHSPRSVLSFTIRDSPFHYVNVAMWGKPDSLTMLSGNFAIGDIVQVSGGNVKEKADQESKYRPWTSSPYTVTLSENHATISSSNGMLFHELTRLAHMPLQSQGPVYTLSDIVQNVHNLQKEPVNFIAAVRLVAPTKRITSKANGRKMQLCEVKLFDQKIELFYLNLWSKELIRFAENWSTNETIVMAINVKVTYDEYKKAVVASSNSKTIITLNPDSREAARLYQFAQTVSWPDESDVRRQSEQVDLSLVQERFNIAKLMQIGKAMTSEEVVYCLTYCFLTTFDIDGSMDSVISAKCCECGRRLASVVTGKCTNYDCLSTGMSDLAEGDVFYNIRVSISDQTGTLENCRLSSEAANKMLRCKAAAFPYLSEDDRTSLKWEYLFERCKVVIKAYRNNNYPVSYMIMQFDEVNCEEYCAKMNY